MIQKVHPHRIIATGCGRYNQTLVFDKVGDLWFIPRGRRPMGKGLTEQQTINYLTNVQGA